MKRKPITDVEYTGAAIALRPDVYADGDGYTVELKQGRSIVRGGGDTIDEALTAWDENLQEHLRSAGSSDKIVQYVMAMLSEAPARPAVDDNSIEAHIASIDDPEAAAELRRFYDQFRG